MCPTCTWWVTDLTCQRVMTPGSADEYASYSATMVLVLPWPPRVFWHDNGVVIGAVQLFSRCTSHNPHKSGKYIPWQEHRRLQGAVFFIVLWTNTRCLQYVVQTRECIVSCVWTVTCCIFSFWPGTSNFSKQCRTHYLLGTSVLQIPSNLPVLQIEQRTHGYVIFNWPHC